MKGSMDMQVTSMKFHIILNNSKMSIQASLVEHELLFYYSNTGTAHLF
jgi:hypothetical protein